MVPEFEDPELRELILHSYRLDYHVTEEVVHVGFVHGARDLAALWEREGRSKPE